jgi:hypothetical protein
MSQVVEKGSRHGLQGEQNFIEKILVALDGSESADKARAQQYRKSNFQPQSRRQR